jgi:hypothetical protein
MAVRRIRTDLTGSAALSNTAVTANCTTNIGDIPTTVNAILVALRAHGILNSA